MHYPQPKKSIIRYNIFFFISCIFSIYINYNIDFFVGTVCLHTESTWGINIMKESVVLFLSGSIIPINFFPDSWAKVISLFPFQYIYNTPLSLLLNNDSSGAFIIKSLLMQLFWCIVTKIITTAFWCYSQKRITVNGG